MLSGKMNKPPKRLNLSIDYSKVAVGIYTYSTSVNDVFELFDEKIDDSHKEAWDRIEYLITFCFERSVPCIEDFQIYKINQKEEREFILLDAEIPMHKLDKALIKKLSDDEFNETLEECEAIVLLLDEFM